MVAILAAILDFNSLLSSVKGSKLSHPVRSFRASVAFAVNRSSPTPSSTTRWSPLSSLPLTPVCLHTKRRIPTYSLQHWIPGSRQLGAPLRRSSSKSSAFCLHNSTSYDQQQHQWNHLSLPHHPGKVSSLPLHVCHTCPYSTGIQHTSWAWSLPPGANHPRSHGSSCLLEGALSFPPSPHHPGLQIPVHTCLLCSCWASLLCCQKDIPPRKNSSHRHSLPATHVWQVQQALQVKTVL